jgi:4-amino-4-deoxy-L-arabinose transferase-like glycosyltransferase
MPVSRINIGLLVLAILILVLVFRTIHLDADPSSLISRDFITDEGWWTHNARNAIFHGQFRLDDYNLGFYSSPLYSYAIYTTLKLLGLSFTTVRLVPAICGWLTVIALFLLVRGEINTRAALFAAVLLGFSDFHIEYSRTGFVESAMVFFLSLALLLWSLRWKHVVFSFTAGVALTLMVITKITAIYLAPGLILMWAALIAKDSRNVRHVVHNLLGISLSGAVFLALYVVPNFHDWLHFNISNGSGSEWSKEPGGGLMSLVKLPGSFFNRMPPMIACLTLLAFFLFAIAVSKSGWRRALVDASEIELISGSLLVGSLIPLAFTIYQPERRLLPAVLCGVILAASVLERASRTGGDSLLGECEGWGWAIWFLILFFLPTVGIVKLTWAALVAPLTLRFWVFKGLVVALFAWTSYVVSKRLSGPAKNRLVRVFSTIFVLVFASLCLLDVNRALTLWGLDWKTLHGSAGRISGSLIFAAIALTSLLLIWRVARLGMSRPVLLVLAFLFVEGTQISTWLFEPTYTMRDASSFFAGTLGANDTIVTLYEELLIPSAANVICRSQGRGFNLDAYERFQPDYTLILRRDNWLYHPLEQMAPDEWPPPARLATAKVATFDLCPTPGRGPRFTTELYRLDPRVRGHDKNGAEK